MLKKKRNIRRAAVLALVVSALLLAPALAGATAIPPDVTTPFVIPDAASAKATVEINWGGSDDAGYWYEFQFTSNYYISEIRIYGEDTSGNYIHPDDMQVLAGSGYDVTLQDREASQSIAIVPDALWLLPDQTADVVRLVYDSEVSTHRIAVSWGASGGTSAWVVYDLDSLADNDPPPVPEPGTLALLGAGILGIAILSRRQAVR